MAIADHPVLRLAETATEVTLALDQIQPGQNPRQTFDQEGLEQLAESIRNLGVLQPILVRPIDTPEGLRYQLLAGERRWRASQLAERTTIPARVLPSINDAQAAEIALIENLHRVDLNPMEEAAGFHELAALGWKQQEIADRFKRSQPAIANTLRLLKLPDDVQARIRTRELSLSHGVALARFEAFPKVASHLAELAVRDRLPAHDVEKGLPRAAELARHGATRFVNDAVFDTAVCEKCPYDAHRKGDYYGTYCLQTDHFDQLQAAATEEGKTKLEQLIAEAETEGKSLPKLKDLDWNSYERLDSRPAGCTIDCPCAAAAIGYHDEIVPICIDTKRHRSLKAKDTKAKTANHKQDKAQLLQQLTIHLDNLTQIGDRELALLAANVLPGLYANELRAALRHVGDAFTEDDLKDYQRSQTRPLTTSRAPALPLLKAMLEGLLRKRIDDWYQNAGGKEPWAGWYLADPADVADIVAKEEAEADRILTNRINTAEGRACFLCDCLDTESDEGEPINECSGDCCDPDCREKGVAVVTERGGVCATCLAENEICRVCGCTNDNACEEGCGWAEDDLCTVCVEKVEVDTAVEVANA